jgi:hypothetical protein
VQTVEEPDREAEPEADEQSNQGPEPEAQAEVAEEPKPKRTPRKKTEETEDE